MVEAVAGIPNEENPAAIETSAAWNAEALTLTITLGCDETGKLTATPSAVATAVGAVDDVAVTATGSGSGVVTPFRLQLAGGEDEPFPLNTPVAIVGTSMLSRLGEKGTLKQALMEINDQRNALTVVVRVAEVNDTAKQRAAVLTGIGALSSARSVTTYQPRIVIAPGFSEDDAVGKALETVAGKLRAVAYVDCATGAKLQEVVQRRHSYGTRTELLRPRVQVSNADGQLVYRPYSAFAAGLRARIDFEKGWWWSKSNRTSIISSEWNESTSLYSAMKTATQTCSTCRTSLPSSAGQGLSTGATVCAVPIHSGASNRFAEPQTSSRTVFRKRCWNTLTVRWTGRMPTTLSAPSTPICASWSASEPFSVVAPGWMKNLTPLRAWRRACCTSTMTLVRIAD